MLRWFTQQLTALISALLGMTLLIFVLIQLIPGDPVEVMMGERSLDPEIHAAARHRLGLDLPLWQQYSTYLVRVLHGDLGQSFITQTPVIEEFFDRFPATIELALFAITFAILLGIPAGIVAAVRSGSFWDRGLMNTALVGYSMPIFWWGLILVMLFSVQWGLTPVSGRIAIEYEVPVVTGLMLIDSWLSAEPGALQSAAIHLVLPTVVLGTLPLAVIARITRAAMLDVLKEDYIRAARARGFSPLRVLLNHALPNALLPILATVGLQVGSLMAGAVLTETLFSWPGVGKWLIDAIHRRDYPVIQGGVLLIALIIIGLNFALDAVYRSLDPRLRDN